MLQEDEVEELIRLVAGLDRPTLLRHFEQFPATFPVDFTPEFLDIQPLERLRHLFVAICLQSKRLPSPAVADQVAAY